MLRELIGFFKRDSFYRSLLVLIALAYGAVAFLSLNHHPRHEDAASVKEFMQTERSFQEQVKKDPALLTRLTRERPMLFQIAQGLTLIFLISFFAGLIFEYRIFFVPSYCRKMTVESSGNSPVWKIEMLVKVLLWFLTLSLLLSFFLGFLKRFIFPDLSENFLTLTHAVLADLLCAYWIFYMVRKEGGVPRDLGFGVPEGGIFREILVGWGGYAALLPLFIGTLIGVVLFADFFAYEPTPHPLVHVFLEEEGSSSVIFYSLLIAVVLGPAIEELFFRGFCYPIFRQKYGAKVAMVITASLFALIHANTFAFWPIFVLGLGLAYLYEMRKSLIAPITLHVTHNALFIAYFFIMKNMIGHYGSG